MVTRAQLDKLAGRIDALAVRHYERHDIGGHQRRLGWATYRCPSVRAMWSRRTTLIAFARHLPALACPSGSEAAVEDIRTDADDTHQRDANEAEPRYLN
jgi:hypothetical protein